VINFGWFNFASYYNQIALDGKQKKVIRIVIFPPKSQIRFKGGDLADLEVNIKKFLIFFTNNFNNKKMAQSVKK
jgi:hypothetical protein